MPASDAKFPTYTDAEKRADRAVHMIGLTAAVIGLIWLLNRIAPVATVTGLVAVLIYGFGLLGMLSASALFNLTPPGRPKAVFRFLDHSMILVMIAGSYTPFATQALSPRVGLPLAGVVWGLAAIGIILQLARPRVFDRVSLALYLCMGWVIVGVFPLIIAALPIETVALLVAGGVIYSVGSVIHTRASMPFHNPVWHAMVVVAACLHFFAVASLFPR